MPGERTRLTMPTRQQNLNKLHLLLKQCFDLAKAEKINLYAVADAEVKPGRHRYYIRHEDSFIKSVADTMLNERPVLKAEILKDLLREVKKATDAQAPAETATAPALAVVD